MTKKRKKGSLRSIAVDESRYARGMGAWLNPVEPLQTIQRQGNYPTAVISCPQTATISAVLFLNNSVRTGASPEEKGNVC